MTKRDKNNFIMKINQRLRRSGKSDKERIEILKKIEGVIYSKEGYISRSTALDEKIIKSLSDYVSTKSNWEFTNFMVTKDDFYGEFEGLTAGEKKTKGYDEKHKIISKYAKEVRRKDYEAAKKTREKVYIAIGKKMPGSVEGFESKDSLNE